LIAQDGRLPLGSRAFPLRARPLVSGHLVEASGTPLLLGLVDIGFGLVLDQLVALIRRTLGRHTQALAEADVVHEVLIEVLIGGQ